MVEMNDKNSGASAASWGLPMGVGLLFLLYGFALWLMSEGEANPALLLAAVALGVGSLGWGYYVKNRG